MAAGIRGPSRARLCRTTRCRSTCSSARCDADVRFCRSLMINCARRAPSAMSSVIRERSSMTKRRSLRGESCKSARNSSSGSRFFPSASAAAARARKSQYFRSSGTLPAMKPIGLFNS